MGLLRGVHEEIMRNHLAILFHRRHPGQERANEQKKQELIDEMMQVTSLHHR